MPALPEYPPGTPCWVDLSTSDPGASAVFYRDLFGWVTHAAPGGYTFFAAAGTPPEQAAQRVVAGLMPGPGSAAWNTYVSVLDAEATAALVSVASGQVLAPPMEVAGQGRMVMVRDDQGAAIAAWQPRAFRGASGVNEPGCFCWTELACRDTAAAAAFYGRVFGWTADTSELGPMTYSEWRLGGRVVGGMVHLDENWPEDIAPRWMVYFAVADCDAVAAQATELSGEVQVPPTDAPPGRLAVLADPQGAAFGVIRLAVSSGPA